MTTPLVIAEHVTPVWGSRLDMTVQVAGEGPPLHIHDQDELIYTLDGTFRIVGMRRFWASCSTRSAILS